MRLVAAYLLWVNIGVVGFGEVKMVKITTRINVSKRMHH